MRLEIFKSYEVPEEKLGYSQWLSISCLISEMYGWSLP